MIIALYAVGVLLSFTFVCVLAGMIWDDHQRRRQDARDMDQLEAWVNDLERAHEYLGRQSKEQ